MIYRAIYYWNKADELSDDNDKYRKQLEIPAKVALVIFLSVNAVFLVLIYVSAVKCMAFFKNGLRDALLSQMTKSFVKPAGEEDDGLAVDVQ